MKCSNCGRDAKKTFPGDVCEDCYSTPSRKDVEEKWRNFTGPPVDRMMDVKGKASEVVTK